MISTELLKLLNEFPTRKLAPDNGMAVTAEVWKEAHNYHDQYQRFHALLGQGPGILTGLNVAASNPADTSVIISPGVAIDTWGRLMVLREAMHYEIGETNAGLNYIWLRYRESNPRYDSTITDDEARRYQYPQILPGAGSTLTEFPHVKLARLRRRHRIATIFDAADPRHPDLDQIDLRIRQETGASSLQVTMVAVGQIGSVTNALARHFQGMSDLAQALNQTGPLALLNGGGQARILVDKLDNWSETELNGYSLLYLVDQGAFSVSDQEATILKDYLNAGGTIFIESCCRDLEGAAPSDTFFVKLAQSLEIELTDVPASKMSISTPLSRLLAEPFRFAVPPSGFEPQGSFKVAAGVLASSYDYGCLWQGASRNQLPSREAIRTGLEWGGNIIAYAAARREGVR